MVLKKRFTSLIKRTNSQGEPVDENDDSPEANVTRGVRLFCESGAANSGEEVLHLPTIVESAVASPVAAQAAANQIRKFLSKENNERPHVQYNAVMLIRILADNPGASFTKNLDKQFADTCKHLLRTGKDPSVGQILRETLDSMHKEKGYDTNLNTLFAMWTKEKKLILEAERSTGRTRTFNVPPWTGQPVQGGFGSHGGGGGSHRGLPPPVELAARIEEAKTSAKLLLQLVQSTPANELPHNDLVKEFAERCTSAQRSVQTYINCDNPPPDDDTMLTLIETNEQLSLAASKHQRAILQSRRAMGASPSPVQSYNNNYSALPPPQAPAATYTPPPQLPGMTGNEIPILPPLGLEPREPAQNPASYKKDELPLPPALQAAPERQRSNSTHDAEDNPFADHHTSGYAAPSGPPSGRSEDRAPANGYIPFSQGYQPQPNPSHLNRQESAVNNLTMRGAVQEDNRETDETHHRQGSDVSPIAERGTVTYRY